MCGLERLTLPEECEEVCFCLLDIAEFLRSKLGCLLCLLIDGFLLFSAVALIYHGHPQLGDLSRELHYISVLLTLRSFVCIFTTFLLLDCILQILIELQVLLVVLQELLGRTEEESRRECRT